MNRDLVRSVPLLAGLAHEDLNRLAGEVEEVQVEPDTLVIEEGTSADALFAILEFFQPARRKHFAARVCSPWPHRPGSSLMASSSTSPIVISSRADRAER